MSISRGVILGTREEGFLGRARRSFKDLLVRVVGREGYRASKGVIWAKAWCRGRFGVEARCSEKVESYRLLRKRRRNSSLTYILIIESTLGSLLKKVKIL